VGGAGVEERRLALGVDWTPPRDFWPLGVVGLLVLLAAATSSCEHTYVNTPKLLQLLSKTTRCKVIAVSGSFAQLVVCSISHCGA
jgi:hypothetical protein